MAKIDIGIDLGTTNSAISRMEKGEPTIIKSKIQKDTTPSCVAFLPNGAMRVGEQAWSRLKSDRSKAMLSSKKISNAFIEFKRAMGTDKIYSSPNAGKDYDAEQLSSEVLKTLKSYIIDEDVPCAVITVPAKFDVAQNDATLRAAKLAGFDQVELLMEPIAAATAYGLTSDSKNGFWVVFDFGGGTFDAALLKVEDGISKVIDTDGDMYLGGKNLDMGIVDEIIIPHLQKEYAIDGILADEIKKQILREAMKNYAEEIKIELSFESDHEIIEDLKGADDEGEDFDELNLIVTRSELKKVIAPIFQQAIDITKDLLERNNLSGDTLDKLILIGGPTHSPILREMLEGQIQKPDTSADPMTAVAVGACLYASTVDRTEDIVDKNRDRTKIQLKLGYESASVETEEPVTIKVVPEKTEGDIPEQIVALIERGDKAWDSGKIAIDDKGEIIDVLLQENMSNHFDIKLFDANGNALECEPSEFLIRQGGVKPGGTVLSHSIGIGISRKSDGREIFTWADELKAGDSLPATGTIKRKKIPKQIRPGNANDLVEIPIYMGDLNSNGTRLAYNDFVYNVVITGDSDIPGLVPAGSEVEITLKTPKSVTRIESMQVYFPHLNHTETISIPESKSPEIEADFIDRNIRDGRKELAEMRSSGLHDDNELGEIENELTDLEGKLDKGRMDFDLKKEVYEQLKKSLKKIDELSDKAAWPKLEQELRKKWTEVEETQPKHGDDETQHMMNALKPKLDEVISKKDPKIGNAILEDIEALWWLINGLPYCISWVIWHDENFNSIQWLDTQRVRVILNMGLENISAGPQKEVLFPIVSEGFELKPDITDPEDPYSGRNLLS